MSGLITYRYVKCTPHLDSNQWDTYNPKLILHTLACSLNVKQIY